MKNFATVLFRVWVLASIAVWFGGFTFYVSIVVPIGTEVLGSAAEQGFITRLVTQWLNLMGGIALVTILAESVFSWRSSLIRPSLMRLRRIQLLLVFLMAVLQVGLFVLHPYMDRLLDPEARVVILAERFYRLHRIYLWASTIQWVFAWFWLFALARSWTPEKPRSTANVASLPDVKTGSSS